MASAKPEKTAAGHNHVLAKPNPSPTSSQPTTSAASGSTPRNFQETHEPRYDDDSDEISLYSSASEDVMIHAYGRTYHGSGRVLTPNDAGERRREENAHELMKLCLGGRLTHAKLPLDRLADGGPGLDVLDVGCGNGMWAIDMAQTYPNARVLGIDLSSVQMPENVPENLTFEVADAALSWPDHMYDYIRVCFLVGGGVRDWAKFLAEAFKHLRPGGQIEFIEIRPRFYDADATVLKVVEDGESRIGPKCQEYITVFNDLCTRLDIDWDPLPRVTGWLADLGAESIRERVDWLPLSCWGPDEITRQKGTLLTTILADELPSMTLMLFGLGGWAEEDTRALIDGVLEELSDPKMRTIVFLTFITARKPLSEPN